MTLRDTHIRYAGDWQKPFLDAAGAVFRPGMVVLDMGGGRRPAIPRQRLPPQTRYIGLDLAMSELRAAPAGSYDDLIEADITEPIPALRESVDLIVSWQVLEHVTSMQAALDNARSYLRPGGRLVAELSGARAFFALLNRALPRPLAMAGLRLLLKRDPQTVFPAPYDHCTYSGLTRLLDGWSRATVLPQYCGAPYVSFSRPVEWLYLKFEDSLVRGRHADLATHYLVVADR